MPPLAGPLVDTSVPSSAYFGSWPGVPGTTPPSVSPNQYSPAAIYRGMAINVPAGVMSLDVWAVTYTQLGGTIGLTVRAWRSSNKTIIATLTYPSLPGIKQKQTLALDGSAQTIWLDEQACITNVCYSSNQQPVSWVTQTQKDVNVLLYTDSVGYGTNANPYSSCHFLQTRNQLPANYDYIDMGRSGRGMTTPADAFDCLARMNGRLKNIWVCTLGVNNYNPGGAVASYASTYQTMINNINSNPGALPGLELLLVTMPNALFVPAGGSVPGGANTNGSTLLDYINATVTLATSNGPNVHLLNLYSPPVWPISSIPSIYTADGVHPENAGMTPYAVAMTAAILAL